MKCINTNCNVEDIEKDDNFCYKCGYWTAKGYTFLSDEKNVKMIVNGDTLKQKNKINIVAGLFALLVIMFVAVIIIRGDNLFKPLNFIKKKSFNYIYGYNTTLIKTDNKYSREIINNYDEAINIIKSDFIKQNWLCFNDNEIEKITGEIENNYSIPSVSFCDMSVKESQKIRSVIDRIYNLFPSIEGALTNITISNAASNSEYIARFQPLYQFVNVDEDINTYNKVNKTQILLNSYYFLNDDIISKPIESVVGENWYVVDATWESTIAHEYGHYISFLTLLKMHGLSNITFESNNNIEQIKDIINIFNSGDYSNKLLNEALNNYNDKYNENLTIEEFANTISRYAGGKDEMGNIISDETIAEAIHDYYLHGDNMRKTSKEIVNVINSRL